MTSFFFFFNEISLFSSLVSQWPSKEKTLTTVDWVFISQKARCCKRWSLQMPSVSVTDEFWSKFSTDCYWKAYRVCRTQDHCKSSTATELGTAVTWASAHSSALTGGLAGFISEHWRALNIFQMCWPHKTATYHSCERSAPRLYSSHPYSHASWAPGLGSPLLAEELGARPEPRQENNEQRSSTAGHFCTCHVLAACALVLGACAMLILGGF